MPVRCACLADTVREWWRRALPSRVLGEMVKVCVAG